MTADRRPRAELGRWVAWVLRAGTLGAIALVVAGYAWSVAAGEPHPAAAPVLDEIAAGGGTAVTALGLLTLTLVPVATLLAAALALARAGERRMAITTGAVVLLLLGALVTAAAIAASI